MINLVCLFGFHDYQKVKTLWVPEKTTNQKLMEIKIYKCFKCQKETKVVTHTLAKGEMKYVR